MATSTASRSSPGFSSSNFSTTWKSPPKGRRSSPGRNTVPSSSRLTAGATGRPSPTASPAMNCSNSSHRTRRCGPTARRARASSPTCAASSPSPARRGRMSSPTCSRASPTAWSPATSCAMSSTRLAASTSPPARRCTPSAASTKTCCAKCATRRATAASSTPRARS